MSPKRNPSNTNRVVKEGKPGNVDSSRKDKKTKPTNIVMGTEAQSEIYVNAQETNQQH